MPAPDLQTIEELCQPTMNRRGGPIAPVNIQATDFGLKNHMNQQVQNSCQFYVLPGDDANKHLDKFLTITQTPDESLFEAWERYKLSIDRCPNHNILPVTQIDTFYNGLTLRHRDTINAAAGGTFMIRRPEECYDLIENMTAQHNGWDSSAHRGESSSSTTSSSEIAALAQQMIEIRKDMLQMYRSNQQVNSLTPSCETCDGPHSYYECHAAGGYTRDVYATLGTYNAGGNSYQPQGNQNLLSYRSNNSSDHPVSTHQIIKIRNQGQNYNHNVPHLTSPSTDEMLRNFMISTDAKFNSLATSVIEIQKSLQERPQDALPSNTIPNLERKSKQLPHVVVLPESTTCVPPLVVQPSPSSRSSYEIPPSPVSTSSEIPKRNPHQPLIPYPSRLNKEKLQEKSDIEVHKFFQMFKKLHFNISLAEALTLMPKYHKMLKDLLFDKEKLLGLANTSLTENCLAVLLKKLLKKLRVPGKFLISCDFLELEKCMALADLGASINLMPLSVWKKLMLHELVPTRMTLELANRSIAYPADIAKDVFVQVGKFTFSADFVVVNYDVDPRVPLILGRPFLRTTRALVDVYGEDLILRDGDEKLIFHTDSTSKCPHKHGNGLNNTINFIDISCEDHFHEVLKFKKSNRDILFLENLLNDDPIKDLHPHELNNDLEGDILILKNLLKGNQFNPIKDIDDPVPIPRVSETPLDSFDSCLDSFDTAFTNPLFELDSEYTLNYDNPIFDVQNEDIDASEKETIIDEVQIDSTTQNSPMFEALIPDMTMHDIILYRIRHGIVHSSRLSFYLGLLFPEGVSESHSLDSFELGDENTVFDPGTVVIKGWIKHYYRGDIPIMDVLDLHFSPKDK
nr:hypothetical protein [Tanacetum cinerariifolium]